MKEYVNISHITHDMKLISTNTLKTIMENKKFLREVKAVRVTGRDKIFFIFPNDKNFIKEKITKYNKKLINAKRISS